MNHPKGFNPHFTTQRDPFYVTFAKLVIVAGLSVFIFGACLLGLAGGAIL